MKLSIVIGMLIDNTSLTGSMLQFFSTFDVTTKGRLHLALHDEYWRITDPQGKPTVVVRWWLSRAELVKVVMTKSYSYL